MRALSAENNAHGKHNLRGEDNRDTEDDNPSELDSDEEERGFSITRIVERIISAMSRVKSAIATKMKR